VPGQDGADDRVVIAHLTRPRGNKGELCAISLTSHPERFEQLTEVQVGTERHALERVWYHNNEPVFKFLGVDSISDAEKLAGQDVSIPAGERLALPEDEYYFADLVGCRVLDVRSGNLIGVVTGWQEAGGPVVLELDNGRVLVPFARAILPKIDVRAREIGADLPDGLLDLNG
jgi:16S rRNA processing protein RimM